MKKTLYYSILLASFLSAASCESTPEKESTSHTEAPRHNALEKLSWLTGSWSGTSPGGTFGESWKLVNDSLYTGKGFFVVGKDTVSSESLRLLQEGSLVFYEPTVNNQNSGKAVRFKMSTVTETTVVFENAAHDFPKKISYTLVTPDSLVAEISGPFKGKDRSEIFPMVRQK